MTHYLDLMLREPEVSHQIHARLLTAVHHRIRAGDTLCVSWPDFKGTPGEFGLLFRVFGDQTALQSYSEAVSPLVKGTLVRAYPIALVPEHTERVSFIRDRSLDKHSPSTISRQRQFVESQGNTWTPAAPPTRRPHFLVMQSITTGETFSLYVRLSKTSGGGGASYGLGQLVPHF